MAIYPDATRVPGNNGGNYSGGPWRIVWHTTEGTSAQGAISAYRRKNVWPHFTVDENTVYQHVDTDIASRALRNARGGVQTNRWHAVQIELVGSAAQAKSSALLAQAARLARWIESIHGVPKLWPNGYPLPTQNARHNRNADTWRLLGGHYGHCHVPENTHWDPGLIDISALMAPELTDSPLPIPDFPWSPSADHFA
jgi:hypothetical protein